MCLRGWLRRHPADYSAVHAWVSSVAHTSTHSHDLADVMQETESLLQWCSQYDSVWLARRALWCLYVDMCAQEHSLSPQDLYLEEQMANNAVEVAVRERHTRVFLPSENHSAKPRHTHAEEKREMPVVLDSETSKVLRDGYVRFIREYYESTMKGNTCIATHDNNNIHIDNNDKIK